MTAAGSAAAAGRAAISSAGDHDSGADHKPTSHHYRDTSEAVCAAETTAASDVEFTAAAGAAGPPFSVKPEGGGRLLFSWRISAARRCRYSERIVA